MMPRAGSRSWPTSARRSRRSKRNSARASSIFEVTANELVTNLFVAVEDATAAVPYVYLDGELQPPAPTLTGASGFTFTADDVDFDEETVLDAVSEELTDSTIEAFSIEAGAGGVVRYVVSTLSPEGGRLDVTVAPDGTVLEVDPL